MALPDLFSRRKRLADQTTADVYQYVDVSPKLKRQFIILLERAIKETRLSPTATFDALAEFFREEEGTFELSKSSGDTRVEFGNWILGLSEVDKLLDVFEFTARYITLYSRRNQTEEAAASFIAYLNGRMLEDGFGYQIEDFCVVRVDSKYLHLEVVLPALHFLSEKQYVAANQEFRQAHKEYVDGNYDDAIHDCCNALESVLKVILTRKKWAFTANDTAGKLLAVAFTNNLIPQYMQAEFSGLRTILESGVPTVRNKDAGHGAGVNPRNIPPHIAAFQLHQTAAAIVLLAEAAK